MTPQKDCNFIALDGGLQQHIEENNYNEKHFVANQVEDIISSEVSKELIKNISPCKRTKVDVGVQCDPESVFQDITSRVFHKLSIIFNCTSEFGSWFRRFLLRLKKSIVDWTFGKKDLCACNAKLLALEEKIKVMEVKNCICKIKVSEDEMKLKQLIEEIKLLKSQVDSIRLDRMKQRPMETVCISSVPPPPPPPPPPPMTPLNFQITKPKTICSKPIEKKVVSSRPLITAEALQSVKLKKVTDRAPLEIVANQSGGPLVTMDQLRSVKLRPRRKHQSQAFSPTRTPLCRDRVFKSRSPGFRKERRPRLDRIPLSTILNMEDP